MSDLVEFFTQQPIARSAFLARTPVFLGLLLADARRVPVKAGVHSPHRHHGTRAGLEHPEPRPDVTSNSVLSAAMLDGKSETVLAAYASARAFPAIFDALACACECTGKGRAHRSLLSCYESLQPTGCRSCQMEAELVARLAKQEKSVAEIRAAVDKEFG